MFKLSFFSLSVFLFMCPCFGVVFTEHFFKDKVTYRVESHAKNSIFSRL